MNNEFPQDHVAALQNAIDAALIHAGIVLNIDPTEAFVLYARYFMAVWPGNGYTVRIDRAGNPNVEEVAVLEVAVPAVRNQQLVPYRAAPAVPAAPRINVVAPPPVVPVRRRHAARRQGKPSKERAVTRSLTTRKLRSAKKQ